MLDLGDPSLYEHLQAPAPTATSPAREAPSLLDGIDFATDSISTTLTDSDRYSTGPSTFGGIQIIPDPSLPPGTIKPVNNPGAYTVSDLQSLKSKSGYNPPWRAPVSDIYGGSNGTLDEVYREFAKSLQTPLDADVILGKGYGNPTRKVADPTTDDSQWTVLGAMADSGIQMTARTWLQDDIKQWAENYDSGDMYASIQTSGAPLMKPILPQYPRDWRTRWTPNNAAILEKLAAAWDEYEASSSPGELAALTLSRHSTPAQMLPIPQPPVPNLLPDVGIFAGPVELWFPKDHPLRALVVE